MNAERPLTGAERVARRRAALRAEGLQPRTFGLPDRRDAAPADRIRADVERINLVRRESDTIAFINAIQYWPEEDYDWGPGDPP